MESEYTSEDFMSQFEEEGTTIGKGSFGSCRVLIHSKTGEKIVMKESKPENKIAEKELKYIKQEGDMFRLLHSGKKVKYDNMFIVKYFHSFKSKDSRYIIFMEHWEGGDLENYINKVRNKKIEGKKVRIKEKKVLEIFVQLLMAVADIHAKNIIHRDIKDKNIFLWGDGRVKLGDYGAAFAMGDSCEIAETIIGDK